MNSEEEKNGKSTKPGKKYEHRTRAYKRAALQELFDEKITVRDFLKKHNIGSSTLYDWKKQIQGDGPDPLINKVILPEELKKKIVREIVSGSLTHEEAQKNYNVPRLETLKAWCSKYSYQIEEPKSGKMENNKDKEESSEETSRIKQLEKALEEAKLKILGLQTMIDVAEKELKIDIRKKPGTKQLKS